MQVIHERCAGLDVHKRTVVACVRCTQANGQVHTHLWHVDRRFAGPLRLVSRLAGGPGSHGEHGGVGKPVYNLLETGCTVVLVNPRHLKAVPGRKTAVLDAEWLADLLRHGVLRASFIPPQPVRDLRELARYRTTLVRERAEEVNRAQKVLEGANIKLASVATDVLGTSGRAMLEALVGGEQDPEALADLARGRLRAKLPALRQAREGRVRSVHQVQLRVLLAHIEFLEGALADLQREIAARLEPFAEAVALAQTLPGVGPTAATAIPSGAGDRYEPVPERRTPRFVGRGVSRQ
jgi:transposase